jgi:hypothetical protein
MQAKDADLAFRVVEEMATHFDVDTLDLKVKALTAICKSIGPREQPNAIVDRLVALMKEAVTKEKFDAAKQLGTTATDVARKSKDSAFIKETVARQGTIIKLIAEVQKAQAKVEEAVDFLDKNPTDPTANLAVGKYTCFMKNQWNKGIPMLALGDDPASKDLAVRELKGMTDAVAQAKLGDAWWDLGEKKNGLAKKNIQGHAASWYQQALPGLTGLVKDRVEKRLSYTFSEKGDGRNKTDLRDWVVVFRSSDPAIWNSDVSNPSAGYAITLAKLPESITYLRMRIDKARFVIIPITKDRLLVESADGRYGWQGANFLRAAGYHLGVYDTNTNTNTKATRSAIGVANFGDGHDRLGWGFGHRVYVDDYQGYSWAGVAIPKTVFEISVKSGPLTKAEQVSLLK